MPGRRATDRASPSAAPALLARPHASPRTARPRARNGALPAFRGFAKRLGADQAAVRAAAMHPWSTGQVEGQINRLKMIKRQMYGRANFDLLAKRFLLAA